MDQATNDITTLRQWIGRSESLDDALDPTRARLMEQTLDRSASLTTGDPLPPLWHWIYFNRSAPLTEHGVDGHPRRGGLIPPVALPRRMWASGQVSWRAPLLLGGQATKTSTITDVESKEGGSGQLCFVTITHEVASEGTTCLVEQQNLVFVEQPAPDAPPRPRREPPDGAEWTRTVTPSSVQLFRYSALTFNTHRIHYDHPYATEVEGYPGLVVHGPLTATLLADLAWHQLNRDLVTFSFRAVAPLFDAEAFAVNGRRTETGAELWAESPEGALAMRADAEIS